MALKAETQPVCCSHACLQVATAVFSQEGVVHGEGNRPAVARDGHLVVGLSGTPLQQLPVSVTQNLWHPAHWQCVLQTVFIARGEEVRARALDSCLLPLSLFYSEIQFTVFKRTLQWLWAYAPC